MDCLDEPLHLQILTSLARNLAKTPAATARPPNGNIEGGPIQTLLRGLPELPVNGYEADEWTDFEVNRAISYAHYVSSLPLDAPYLPHALPRLKQIIAGLLEQGSLESSDEPTTSAGFGDLSAVGTASQARLCETLLSAVLWVGWGAEGLRDEVVSVLDDLLSKILGMVEGDGPLTFPLVMLSSVHAVISRCPLPSTSGRSLPGMITKLVKITAPGYLLKLLKYTSNHNSPPQVSSSPFTAPHPQTPGALVMLIAEILNILLATPLMPITAPRQRAFTHQPEPAMFHRHADNMASPVPAEQTRLLVKAEIDHATPRLSGSQEGQAALRQAQEMAMRWWSELMGLGEDTGITRRNSVLSMGGTEPDEEIEITVAVLHLLNLLSLHEDQRDQTQLPRLKLLLSENSTIGDARVLEAAFVCTSILVRNQPSLGPSLVHHIRRLLSNPLPAFEGEMAAFMADIPPAVVAASQCLGICVQSAPNDDLISSTLYSLLNLLVHGAGGSSISPGITLSMRSSQPSRNELLDGSTMRSGGSSKRTEEQRRLVAVTAVQVVSRLALEVNREDIIHLSISMLLQRLRGVDLIIEATIACNLVPLALASSNTDLVDVYRAFSQISRSSHPEDPRMASNAVLAAQTTLAKGLGKRLDCADGYLVELLTLFADKGTQTQMIAMAPSGFDTHDKEKLAHLKSDSEARVNDMKNGLAALLIPISALLSHPTYYPAKSSSPELVAHFRNLWFICVAFGICGSASKKRLSEHELHALSNIAEKTPALILENATDYVASDLEYNSVLRKDFAAHILAQQRATLAEYLPHQRIAYHIRTMSSPQITLLLAVHDLEILRTARYRPSFLLQYFANESVNNSTLLAPMESIAGRVSATFLKQLSQQVVVHSLPDIVSDEVCAILVGCTHRYRKVREIALTYARQILETFSALMCDRKVVFTLLEILTLMRNSCELQFTDEYSPVYEFKSDKMDLTLQLTEDFAVRNEIVTQLHSVAKSWLTLAISRAPIEVQSTLQSYLGESRDVLLIDSVEMGAGLALHYSKAISRLDRQETMMPTIGGWPSDCSNLVASQFAAKNYFTGELSGVRHVVEQGLKNLEKGSPVHSSEGELLAFKSQMAQAVATIRQKKSFAVPEIRRILLRAVSVLTASQKMDSDIIHYLVELPMAAFTPLAIAAGVDAWTWLLRQRPEAEVAVMGEISAGWLETIRKSRGMFSTTMNYRDPFENKIEFAPSDKKVLDLELAKARKLLRPHLLLIQVLSSQFQAIKYRQPGIMTSLIRVLMRSLAAHKKMCTHPLAREVRFSLLLFGFQILASSKMEALLELRFRDRLFAAAFAWFSVRPQWSYGSNRIQVAAEIKLLQDFMSAVQEDQVRGDYQTSSMTDRSPALLIRGSTTLHDYVAHHKDRVQILRLLVENEISRLNVWCNPTNETGRTTGADIAERALSPSEWPKLVAKAWRISPAMAVHMGERFKYPAVQTTLTALVREQPKQVIAVPEALRYLLGEKLEQNAKAALQWLPVWAAIPPVAALVYFQPRYGNHPLLLQYAMRVLEQHEVELTFFFVPQVVQALRSDALGYVERFIFETSKISQLFCHQIIWNMKANTHKDDNAEEEDPMKPLLDRMIDMIVAGLSGKAKRFYDTEFTFFGEITSISGKLKPYIKKSKPEKKAKIDEEMAQIELQVGVYLPSNPDGIVIDLDRKSGRPLQSHAKAPFMATFKVRRERLDLPSDANIEISDEAQMVKTSSDVWQAAIFKVGDDCRQDVLALQVIAMFRNVFDSVGLTLYLFPYRVTATAPGCGVIDVVPNATSRDEMGRAKINDLFSYFVDKYGGVDTIPFQKARMNFIQSMAAYSVACYILQIKDRHNGNIMIDADGHIVHVDFGFLFDIGPGGIKFEPNSFKLNHEMVALMGGRDSQGYRTFAELTVKAFLAIRPHADQLIHTVHLMLGTALPSFKGEPTIRRLRERFQLQLTERAAAEYMMGVIRNAHENMRSNVYDGFQKIQNGIPY